MLFRVICPSCSLWKMLQGACIGDSDLAAAHMKFKPEFLTQTCLSEGAHWDPHVFLYGKRYALILKPSSAPEAINFTIS